MRKKWENDRLYIEENAIINKHRKDAQKTKTKRIENDGK